MFFLSVVAQLLTSSIRSCSCDFCLPCFQLVSFHPSGEVSDVALPFIALTTWTGIPDTGHGITGLSLEGGEEADDDDNIAYKTVLVGEGDGLRMVGEESACLEGRAWVGREKVEMERQKGRRLYKACWE